MARNRELQATSRRGVCEYGKPGGHTASGLVLGAFGKLSTGSFRLAYAIGRVRAISYLSYFDAELQGALVLHKTGRSPPLGPDRTTGVGPAHPQSLEGSGGARRAA